MRNILVDTGAIIGLLNKRDRHHSAALHFFAHLRQADELITTWAVVTECSFALERNRAVFYDWLLSSSTEIVPFDLDDVRAMWAWMQGYSDREVDFADASLVWLGDRRQTDLIATTDFNDFQSYRLPNKKPFRLLIAMP